MFQLIAHLLKSLFSDRTALAMENLALRQQLAVYEKTIRRPKLTTRDRFFWVLMRKFCSGWEKFLLIVQPETVVKWHRMGFRLFWRWKSKRRGRPKVPRQIRNLIRLMSRENRTWGAPRIAAELALLGYDLAESTVARYMIKHSKPPSSTWRTFLSNHMSDTVGIDFLPVPTATFRILFCLVVISHDRRKILYFNVSANPTAQWAAQQIVQTFHYDSAPKYLLRDRDDIFQNPHFMERIKNMGIEEVRSAPQSPWQNPYTERVIGSIRRECLNHIIILNENHLCRILKDYFQYYNSCRTHQSLERNSPDPRKVEPPEKGKIISIPQVGGLHHVYRRVA